MANLGDPIELTGDDEPIEIDAGEDASSSSSEPTSRIQTFGTKSRHVDKWDRTPNVTGTGAIHCKIFHAKLREDALDYLEEQINEWLDKHPEYEVKEVTSSIGELKLKSSSEPAMFVTVWV